MVGKSRKKIALEMYFSATEILIPQAFFAESSMRIMQGKITAGLGLAGSFLSREGYRRQFLECLGFVPFPGTLNVLLDEPLPPSAPAILIQGFSEGVECFGGCRCYHISINGMAAAVIRPESSRHPPELIEVIAPANLRRTLDLKDGDSVEVII
jgi:riboflavin kinase, archaea type